VFEKILVAVDGSRFSDAAVTAAGSLAAKTGSEVEVVHVHEHLHSRAGGIADLETSDEAETTVAAAVAKLTAQGVTAHGRVLEGGTRDVPRRIIDCADETGAGLIIVGRRGLSGLTEMLVGSVSNKLIHVANVPVMVAH